MAAKKNKSILHRELDATTESIALGSAFSVLFVAFVKSIVLAIPLGLAIAFAHYHGRNKKRSRQK